MASLAIDIGNTRVKAAAFDNGRLVESALFLHEQKNAIAAWIDYHHPLALIISSTAEKEYTLDDILPDKVHIVHLDTETPLPIKNSYQSTTLGRDRIANAVGGYSIEPTASLVIDAGTCVTYDWTIDGEYLGGGISPGLHMRLKAMHEFTGRLPLVDGPFPTELIGRDTQGSLNSGAFHGLLLETQGIIKAFHSRFSEGKVLLTGGDGRLLAEQLENDIFADPLLTLRGLNAILQFHNA